MGLTKISSCKRIEAKERPRARIPGASLRPSWLTCVDVLEVPPLSTNACTHYFITVSHYAIPPKHGATAVPFLARQMKPQKPSRSSPLRVRTPNTPIFSLENMRSLFAIRLSIVASETASSSQRYSRTFGSFEMRCRESTSAAESGRRRRRPVSSVGVLPAGTSRLIRCLHLALGVLPRGRRLSQPPPGDPQEGGRRRCGGVSVRRHSSSSGVEVPPS